MQDVIPVSFRKHIYDRGNNKLSQGSPLAGTFELYRLSSIRTTSPLLCLIGVFGLALR